MYECDRINSLMDCAGCIYLSNAPVKKFIELSYENLEKSLIELMRKDILTKRRVTSIKERIHLEMSMLEYKLLNIEKDFNFSIFLNTRRKIVIHFDVISFNKTRLRGNKFSFPGRFKEIMISLFPIKFQVSVVSDCRRESTDILKLIYNYNEV